MIKPYLNNLHLQTQSTEGTRRKTSIIEKTLGMNNPRTVHHTTATKEWESASTAR